jgi:uncharacterized membrane protein (UPF0127 family)
MAAIKKNKPVPLFESFNRMTQFDGKRILAKLAGKDLVLNVASTPESQERGYMNGVEPSEKEGIIFVYPESATLQFWMKNVNFDLDIIFFDSNMNYVSHQTMSKYNGESDHELTRYMPTMPSMYAVETKAGWFEKYGSPDCKLSF